MGLSPGTKLGRFSVVRQLGAGAMGEVYLAEDPDIERQVAIKTVRLADHESLEGSQGTQLRLRLQREAKAAGRLVHSNIVTLFEAGESEGLYYLVFEFIEGTDLATRRRHPPPLEVAEIVRIGRETAAALDAAHRVGIIHRDIKPANLLLTADGTVKVGDFGIAALAGQGSQLTQTGSVIGTPQYLSPEQVRSELPLDGRSDLFALGVVLYELLAGRRPFEGASVAALLYEIVMAEPRHLGELRPDLPPRLTAAVMRLLAKDAGERFASAGELRDELAGIETDLASDPAAVTEVAATEPAPTLRLDAAAPTLRLGVSQAPTQRIDDEAPTLRVDAREPRPRRKGRAVAIGAVVTLGLLGGTTATIIHFGFPGEDRPSVERTVPEEPATDRVPVLPVDVATKEEPPVGDVVGRSTATTTDARPEPVDSGPAPRIVGGVVTFRVRPEDAATSAVVRVDGLVRGLASGSAMTVRPGRHEIVITSPGFRSETIVVDARAGSSAPTEIEVVMTRSP
jgi:eukaryotic-like serine/threonine-protein kinase